MPGLPWVRPDRRHQDDAFEIAGGTLAHRRSCEGFGRFGGSRPDSTGVRDRLEPSDPGQHLLPSLPHISDEGLCCS